MKKNTITTAGSLNIHDRFYKLHDKNKTVLEVKSNPLDSAYISAKKDFEQYPFYINKKKEVVFLRNSNETLC